MRNVHLCFITFMNVDLDYLQDRVRSLQSQHLLFLRSHKDREDVMEKETLWVSITKDRERLPQKICNRLWKLGYTTAVHSLIHRVFTPMGASEHSLFT